MASADTTPALLESLDLCVDFPFRDRQGGRHVLRAVDHVSLSIHAGESVGLVGESGCGKTTVARALVGLQAPTRGAVKVGAGQAGASGRLSFPRHVQMVFQNPMGSLNPRMMVGAAIREVLDVHRLGERHERAAMVEKLLEDVGMDPQTASRYPHEFSGGQRQRIGIARALAANPQVVVADEPVSALDVSVQAQILNLLRDLRASRGVCLLLISHDLAVVRYLCDRVLVMVRGRVVEAAPVRSLFDRPAHPYTLSLLASVPDVAKSLRGDNDRRASPTIEEEETRDGVVVRGCAYAQRCAFAEDRCHTVRPENVQVAPDHVSACHLAQKVASVGAPTGTAPDRDG